jgi:hypothetical protein
VPFLKEEREEGRSRRGGERGRGGKGEKRRASLFEDKEQHRCVLALLSERKYSVHAIIKVYCNNQEIKYVIT